MSAKKGFVASPDDMDLPWDFTKWVKDEPDLKGIIGEPSDDDIQEYRDALRDLTKESGIADFPTDEDLRENPRAMEEYQERVESFDAMAEHHQIVKLTAALCQDSPSADQISKLPYRKRLAFIKYVQNTFVRPEV